MWKDRSALVAYALAASLSLIYVFNLYPLSFLAGKGYFFEEGDAAQHVTGWLFYAKDYWHFPLLYTTRLNYPEGVSIVFTDSIPLAALPFKTFSFLLSPHFQYIGLWNFLAYITQAVAATFLIRSLGVRHILGITTAIIFAITWPTLAWRFGHTSLMTHSIILFALAFYFLGRHGDWHSNKASFFLILLSLLGLMVHPYFIVFCQLIFFAFIVDQAISGEGWIKQLPRILTSFLAIAIVASVLGYFGNSATASGYGFYSMNMTAPFCGGPIFPCFTDATGGQYEGYNYLGAGLIVLIPFAILAQWPQ